MLLQRVLMSRDLRSVYKACLLLAFCGLIHLVGTSCAIPTTRIVGKTIQERKIKGVVHSASRNPRVAHNYQLRPPREGYRVSSAPSRDI